MRKYVISLSMLFAVSCAAAQIGLGTFIHIHQKVYYPGTITFMDGHESTYSRVELAKGNSETISVYTGKDKKEGKETFQASDIYCITYWTEDFPENTSTLFHAYSSKVGLIKEQDRWGYPIMQSAWGSVLCVHPTYTLDKEDGLLYGDWYSDQYGIFSPIPCVLACKDRDEAILICQLNYGRKDNKLTWFRGGKKHRQETARVFAAVPAIEDAFANGKADIDNLQEYLDEMARVSTTMPTNSHPFMIPTSTNTPQNEEEQPETGSNEEDNTEGSEEESAENFINGTSGDDE